MCLVYVVKLDIAKIVSKAYMVKYRICIWHQYDSFEVSVLVACLLSKRCITYQNISELAESLTISEICLKNIVHRLDPDMTRQS